MATVAANAITIAIAAMKNKLVVRDETLRKLDQKILHLRSSIEASIAGLLTSSKVSFRPVQPAANKIFKANSQPVIPATASKKPKSLLAVSLAAMILSKINRNLNHDTIADRMADAGYGPATRTTTTDVLNRLKTINT